MNNKLLGTYLGFRYALSILFIITLIILIMLQRPLVNVEDEVDEVDDATITWIQEHLEERFDDATITRIQEHLEELLDNLHLNWDDATVTWIQEHREELFDDLHLNSLGALLVIVALLGGTVYFILDIGLTVILHSIRVDRENTAMTETPTKNLFCEELIL